MSDVGGMLDKGLTAMSEIDVLIGSYEESGSKTALSGEIALYSSDAQRRAHAQPFTDATKRLREVSLVLKELANKPEGVCTLRRSVVCMRAFKH